jgi:hypothetical protein
LKVDNPLHPNARKIHTMLQLLILMMMFLIPKQINIIKIQCDVPPNFLKDLNVDPKTKQWKKKKIGACSQNRTILG